MAALSDLELVGGLENDDGEFYRIWNEGEDNGASGELRFHGPPQMKVRGLNWWKLRSKTPKFVFPPFEL